MDIENELNPNETLQDAQNSLDQALNSLKQTNNKTEEVINQEPEEIVDIQETEQLSKPKKNDFVDTDDPKIQNRINELYKKNKQTEESNNLLRSELLKITNTFAQKENDLTRQLHEIQNKFKVDDQNATLTTLREEYKKALEDFDYDKALQLNEKILDFKINIQDNNKKVDNEIRYQPKPQPTVYNDPQDVVDANKFLSETDESGQIKRPWLQENHPDFFNVVDMMAAISNKYIRQNQRPSLSVVINEMDKIMGIGQNKNTSQENTLRHAPVLSSNTSLNAGLVNKADNLSPLEKSYAAKLGVSDKEYAKIKKLGSGPISIDNL